MAKQSVIFFFGEKICLLEGSGNSDSFYIRSCHSWPLPHGAFINGLVTDEESLVRALEFIQKKAKLKKVKLILDSSQIMTKNLSAPRFSVPKTKALAAAELSELDTTGRDLVYDYSQLGLARKERRTQELLCIGADQGMVTQFQNLFSRAGLHLAGMEVSLSSTIRAVECLPELQKKSFILCVLDGQTVVTYLFGDGQYLMSSRSRLLTQRGDAAVAGELIGRISSMRQFSLSQKEHAPAENVYFAGMSPEELAGCGVITDSFGLAVGPVPQSERVVTHKGVSSFVLADWLVGMGALVKTKYKSVDLLAAAKKPVSPGSMEDHPKLLSAVAAASLAAVLLGFGAVSLWNLALTRSIQELQVYTADPANIAAAAATEQAESAAVLYESALEELRGAGAVLTSAPSLTTSILDGVSMAAYGNRVEPDGVYTFDPGSGSLTFTCLASDYRTIPGFIRGLKNTGNYSSVSFSGCTLGESGYTFSVTAVVKGDVE